jgi:hypothetical protein
LVYKIIKGRRNRNCGREIKLPHRGKIIIKNEINNKQQAP